MKIENLERLIGKLRDRAAKARRDSNVSVAVGFTAAHAIHVHENMEAKLMGQPRPSGIGNYWGPSLHGPKFLERPARELAVQIASICREGLRRGLTMAQALLRAGLFLQRESQKRVPVEYGTLRASAFTRLEQ